MSEMDSDNEPLLDLTPPASPIPTSYIPAYRPTPPSGPLIDIDEAELKRILNVPPALTPYLRDQPYDGYEAPVDTDALLATGSSHEFESSTETPSLTQSYLQQSTRFRPKGDPHEEYVVIRTPPLPPPPPPSLTGQQSTQLEESQWFQPTGYQALVNPFLYPTHGYQLAPTDWRPPGDPSDPHSGELDVSSDVEQQSSTGVGSRVRQWYNRLSNRNVDDMTRKTIRDLNKLKQKGFDVKYGRWHQIGRGGYGAVYTGNYTARISTLTDIEGRYIGAAQPGDKFAAKYIQIDNNTVFECRLFHEIEKHVMKRLASHPNIISFKMAINLGAKRPVITNQSNHYFYSYDRMFIIMDLADKSTLAHFVKRDKCNDSYAIRFTNQLCNGMHYMHTNGIIHGDVHSKNVLLFSGQNRGQLVAKYIDFGRSLSRDHWSGSELTDQEFHDLQRQDITQLLIIFGSLVRCVQRVGRRNTGANLQPTRDLMDHLKQDNITLDIALKNTQ